MWLPLVVREECDWIVVQIEKLLHSFRLGPLQRQGELMKELIPLFYSIIWSLIGEATLDVSSSILLSTIKTVFSGRLILAMPDGIVSGSFLRVSRLIPPGKKRGLVNHRLLRRNSFKGMPRVSNLAGLNSPRICLQLDFDVV